MKSKRGGGRRQTRAAPVGAQARPQDLGVGDNLEISIDWSDEFRSPIGKQKKDEKTCWGYSISGVTEVNINIGASEGFKVQFDAKELIKNVGTKPSKGLSNMGAAYKSIMKEGITNVIPGQRKKKVFIGNYEVEEGVNERTLLRYLNAGPVCVILKIGTTFKNLKDGIYEGDTEAKEEHSVVVVGYGTTRQGQSFWKVRNSWGADWGENGCGKIMRAISNNGITLFDKIHYPILLRSP